jgi:hypothetical protein
MGVTVEHDQGSPDVYRFDFQGKWTWQELLETISRAIHMGDSTIRNDIIVNLDNANYIPPGALEKLRNITRNTPANGGLYIIVGVNSVTSAVIGIFRRVYKEGRPWRVVRTVDEARELIKNHRAGKIK